MRMRLILSLLVAVMAQSAAAATLTCTFAQECVDADGCADSTYETTYSYELTSLSPTSAMSGATRSDVSGDVDGIMTKRDDIMRFVAGEFFEASEETLTVAPSGDARLVVLLPDVPMLLSYVGTCEEAA